MKKLTALLILATILCSSLFAQNSNFGKSEALEVLRNAKEDIKKHYYDKEFHGINLDEHFKKAEEQIKQAQSTGQLMGIIARAMIDFNDSHLFFLPPPKKNRTEYGFELRAFGENVFVYAVQPGSNAEAKGVKPGDQIDTINDYQIVREKLWLTRYLFYTIRPEPALRLVLKSPDTSDRSVEVNARIIQGRQVTDLTNQTDSSRYYRKLEAEDYIHRQRYEKIEEEVFIWKMPQFDLSQDQVDAMFGRIKKCKSLILDLRGNGGGYIETMRQMVVNVFDHEIKIAERKARKELKPIIAKERSGNFQGKIIVLIDSSSGSASEIFARVIQLEKRGTVLGDRSAGAVMESLQYSHQIGLERIIPYGFSVTDADVIMKDGKSIEHVGVSPDEMIIPTGKDLATGRDPVLARAVEILGGKLTAEAAGKMFPIEWVK